MIHRDQGVRYERRRYPQSLDHSSAGSEERFRFGEGHRPPCELRSAGKYWDIDVQRAEIASSKFLCAPLRRPDFLTSALRFLVVFRSMDLTREASEWRPKRKTKGIVWPTTTDRAPVSRLTRAFCGLQKLSADSSPASRPGLRPPPMTTSHGHDRDRFSAPVSSTWLVCPGDGQTPEQNGQGRSVGGPL